MDPPVRVVVAGGGLAGLVAADGLVRGGAEVLVLEEGDRFGGQIHTERVGGFVVEHGAEGFTARSEAVRQLCGALGLGGRIIPQRARQALLLRDGKLSGLDAGVAAGLLGIPVAAGDLGQGLASLESGMGELIDALVGRLRGVADLRLQSRVRQVAREFDRWSIRLENGAEVVADAVLLALPPEVVSRIIPGLVPPPPAIAGRSIMGVSLAFAGSPPGEFADASGVVFDGPRTDGLTACTFSSLKFAHRAPGERYLVRLFFRPRGDHLESESGELVARALQAITELGIGDRPLHAWPFGWPSALPRYEADHAGQVARFRHGLEPMGGLHVAGAFYDGPGIDGAARSGRDAARSLLRGIPSI
jgi:protoporphyrinogen/coproporphyrinogen III oxidase